MKHSNSLYTVEDETFTEPRKGKGSGWWKWSIAIFVCALFVYRSTRPVLRLAADPPPSFYEYNRSWSREEQRQERRLAKAYWQVAVHQIQGSYSPDGPLPEDPPPQFQIAEAAQSLESEVIAARVHYWYRLREVWKQRDAWVVSYGWNTDWVDNTLYAIPQYMPRWVSNAFQELINIFKDIAQTIEYH